MPTPSSPDVSPLLVEGIIARSKSRYKGPRPRETRINLSNPPVLSLEQLRRLRKNTLSPREPIPQNDGEDRRGLQLQPPLHETIRSGRGSVDDAQRSEAYPAQKREYWGKAKNRTALEDDSVLQTQALQDFQQDYPCRRYDQEAESLKETGQSIMQTQKAAASPEQHRGTSRADMRYLHDEESATTVRSPEWPRRGLTQRVAEHSDGKRPPKSREELKRTISAPITIEPPQDTRKPAFDAPVSAVNAGERRVQVKYGQNFMSLPVTPSTTPLDIIRSATDHLATFMDPHGTILLESFKQLGLERPLRRYEHVRDVLNSWDNDTQNILEIQPSPTGGKGDLLDIYSVSNSQPVDTSVYIHYSQRPGRWDKRWVTLRSDGQMLVAKREGGEATNICHISDFDIYIPKARQSAKRIRPPRKICFAVKSQQKSSMFLSTANFVHFFSTSDRTLAASWYNAILQWRSWYLINVLGEGEERAQESERISTKEDIQRVSGSGPSKSDSRCRLSEPPSQGMSQTTASTLASQHRKHIVPFIKDSKSRHNIVRVPVDDMLFRSRSGFRAPHHGKPTKDTDISAPRKGGSSFVQTVRQEEPEPFAATGLLGRTYTQRQRAQIERERMQNDGPDQSEATPKMNPISGLNRAASQHPKPKPLIDLTPQYQEPPQHLKKGRGVVLEQIPAGGLIEAANTPEAAIPIPPSTTWRRPTSRGGDGPSIGRYKTVRRDHSSGATSEPKQTSASPENGGATLAGGLLASNRRGQGGARMGRGVMTGNRHVKEPMLNVEEEPQYAPGSLLERVTKQDGGSRPIIEREK